MIELNTITFEDHYNFRKLYQAIHCQEYTSHTLSIHYILLIIKHYYHYKISNITSFNAVQLTNWLLYFYFFAQENSNNLTPD